MSEIKEVVEALKRGDVIAYPTEGVFGVGCDPDNAEAIGNLLEIKQRPVEKGLILIAASYEQLLPYLDVSQLTSEQLNRIHQTWPGPVTWIIPASERVTNLVSGQFDSVAVRVTDHPLVRELCTAFGKPVTSTSANLTGQPPCMTNEEVISQLGNTGIVLLEGETGGRNKPSEIRDAKSLEILRKG